MKSAVIKRSIVINGHKTSVSLEDEFWQGLKAMGGELNNSLADIVAEIDAERKNGNLSSAIRIAVFGYFDRRAERGA